jgi:hypothetical protein
MLKGLSTITLPADKDALVLACRGLAIALNLENLIEIDTDQGHHLVLTGDIESLARLEAAMHLMTGAAPPPSQRRESPASDYVEVVAEELRSSNAKMPLPREISSDGNIRVASGSARVPSVGTLVKHTKAV